MTTTAGELAASLLDFVVDQLDALASGPLPGLTLPGIALGHEVGPDVRADLLFTLGLLHGCDRGEAGGVKVPDAIAALLAGVHGRRTHTFFSYRVAETVARFGEFGPDNPVLSALTPAQRDSVAQATDSTDWLELLDGGALPRNYSAVLARCEHARAELGLAVDSTVLDALLATVRSLLGGYLDDSTSGIGRYDIYTVDIYLFCEPLAAVIGDPWSDGAQQALTLVDRVAGRDGAAVAWGRSTGALGVCHTIELAGLVARHDLVADPRRWYARAALAARRLDDWFAAGWVTAHQHRSSDPYRGLDRRLQMTFDCLGKLVDAARGLRGVATTSFDVDERALFDERDDLFWFDEPRRAGVWTYRSPTTAFTLPLVGATTTDYLPAPRNPGLHEVPVGSGLTTGTPLVLHRGVRFAGGGLPTSVEHRPGELRATYDGFPEGGQLERGPDARTFPGRRDVRWRVEGRGLHVLEELTFDTPPHAVALQVVDPAERPLHVRFDADIPHTVATIDVDGLAEYRSCWSQPRRAHQIDLEPTTSMRLSWSITPLLRVVSTAAGHPYNDSLYRPMVDRVRVERLPHSAATQPDALRRMAWRVDQLHMHWPEWTLPIADLDAHRRLADGLRDHGVRIVWTMHNLTPHTRDPGSRAVYETWAAAADLVIHHSEWGRQRARATYAYRDDCRHVVIPHGHWGDGRGEHERAEVERELGLRAGVLRLGIVGAPRPDKDVELAMRAMARSARDDIELLVLSLRGDEAVPADPRIVAREYELVAADVYNRRLAALDALLMPFDPDGDMLATGTVADAVGCGLATICSDWPYTTEVLGAAAIVYGRTEDDLVGCLDALDRDTLDAAASASAALQPPLDWSVIAETTYAELDRLGSARH
jgi:glycosyltransferase involved in cell wall biosynthesis